MLAPVSSISLLNSSVRHLTMNVVDINGATKALTAKAGNFLGETLAEAEVPGFKMPCGGGGVCGHCHVIIDQEHAGKVAAPSEDEKDVLEDVTGVTEYSRLACQVELTDQLDGATIKVM